MCRAFAWVAWVLANAVPGFTIGYWMRIPRAVIRRALELGINFFDTADVYSGGTSEQFLGRVLKDHALHDEVVIATKVYFPMKDGPNTQGLSRKHILDAADASLKRLDTDYIDLYIIHRRDYQTPIEETMEVLDSLGPIIFIFWR